MNIIETKLYQAERQAKNAAIAVHSAIRDAKSIGERESLSAINTMAEKNLLDAQQTLALYRAGKPAPAPVQTVATGPFTGVINSAGDPMYGSKTNDLRDRVYAAVLAAKAANPGGSVNRVALNKAMGSKCASIRAELRF